MIHRKASAYADHPEAVRLKELDKVPEKWKMQSNWSQMLKPITEYNYEEECMYNDDPEEFDFARYTGDPVELGHPPSHVRIIDPEEIIVRDNWNGQKSKIHILLDYKLRDDDKAALLVMKSKTGTFTRGEIAAHILIAYNHYGEEHDAALTGIVRHVSKENLYRICCCSS